MNWSRCRFDLRLAGSYLRYDPPIAEDRTPLTTEEPTTTERVSTLRGAGVGAVNARRVGTIVVGLSLVALTVLVVVFFVAGVHKNDQINDLRQHGVPVEVTVTGCTGLLGGSGSNGAGYACKGTFSVDSHRYDEAIPGNTLYAPGTKLRAVTVPGDPELFSTARIVDSEHPSGSVFILPVILLAVLVLLVASLVLIRRRAHTADPLDS
jgi:hypothetical protein